MYDRAAGVVLWIPINKKATNRAASIRATVNKTLSSITVDAKSDMAGIERISSLAYALKTLRASRFHSTI